MNVILNNMLWTCQGWLLWFQIFLWAAPIRCQYDPFSGQPINVIRQPVIREVTAMCSIHGITAQIMFTGPFNGKIYSERYPITHDCVYYNSFENSMILFSIPNYKCGTRIIKDPNNVIQQIQNEVYVQYDKDTQTAADRRYLFICDNGRSGSPGRPIYPLGPTFTGTIRPDQTIIVQTVHPSSVIADGTASGSILQPNVYMQIQDGIGPFAPPVSRTLQLGETLTIVVGAHFAATAGLFDMQVHSCYADDGTGNSRVLIIDSRGCSGKKSITGPLQKRREPGRVILYATMKAFKFPTSEDVYFTCSVNTCGACNFKPPCSPGDIAGKRRRSLNPNFTAVIQNEKFELSESIHIGHYEGNFNKTKGKRRNRKRGEQQTGSSNFCIGQIGFACLLTGIGLLLTFFISLLIHHIIWRKTILRQKDGIGISPGQYHHSSGVSSSTITSTNESSSTAQSSSGGTRSTPITRPNHCYDSKMLTFGLPDCTLPRI